MVPKRYFTPNLFDFLEDLAHNNEKSWFQQHKLLYEKTVQHPLIDFIADFQIPLKSISLHLVADPRKVGGSLFRIYRDVRFSKDKRPYKTNAGAHFRHGAGKDAHAPGFYLHLEPRNCFGGAGIWRPSTPVLNQIRDAIVKDTDAWQRAVSEKTLGKSCQYNGDSLKRAPKGYDPLHPMIADLKRKDFAVMIPFTEEDIISDTFMEMYLEFCRSVSPYMKFLTNALDLPY